MFSKSMQRYEPLGDEPEPGGLSHAYPEVARTLQEHVQDGLSPELALDLALNELVTLATAATKASAGAIALARGEEMVCRATTGDHAPDLGVPLNTRDGLSGACLRSRQPQLCLDTESDPRVDADASRRLGIRSMLSVPVLEGPEVIGVMEVFSPRPLAFSDAEQTLLESFARDCARLRHMAGELARRPPPPPGRQVIEPTPFVAAVLPARKAPRAADLWTLILSTLVIVAAAALSFLIGSRIGWLRFSPPQSVSEMVTPAAPKSDKSARPPSERITPPAAGISPRSPTAAPPDPGGLVVYERGKVVFRMRPGQSKPETTQSAAESAVPLTVAGPIWLAPETAETRLAYRVEPQYPADARAAHRSGDVVLEVSVGNDGSVATIRAISGDPLLVSAATEAVRHWRYEPYRSRGRVAEFQTDVTLRFALPD